MFAEIDFPDVSGRLRLAFDRPLEVLQADRLDQVMAVIRAAEDRARRGHWVIGGLAYEAAPAFDPALVVHAPQGGEPLVWFAVFDRPLGVVPEPSGQYSCGSWQGETTRGGFDADLQRIHEDIRAGRYYQTNYSTRYRADFAGDPLSFHRGLAATQPDGYCLYLDGGPWQILSASPELFFDWRPDGGLTVQPMKGTAARHRDETADDAAARELLTSPKERAENLMIVDLLRNDMSRLAVTGSVRVPQLFQIEPLPTAWQMTSTVECVTRPGTGLSDVFRALFPCGSITGAPKVTAMRAIAELEQSARGIYCGALGVLRPGGHATFNVAIRTVTLCNGKAVAGVGSGVTLDSRPDAEFAEWQVKRRFLLRAAAQFELLETLRLEQGAYWFIDRHLARLRHSAAHFGFALEEAVVHAVLDVTAATHPSDSWRVRLRVDREGVPHVDIYVIEPEPENVCVTLAGSAIEGDRDFLLHKTTERSAYGRHAPGPGVFDVLLWNERGELTEFTRGNLVVEINGRRLTPPVSSGLLPGVLRAELLEAGEIEEAVLRREDLGRASRLAFINSVRGWIDVELIG